MWWNIPFAHLKALDWICSLAHIYLHCQRLALGLLISSRYQTASSCLDTAAAAIATTAPSSSPSPSPSPVSSNQLA
ncbi:hypothetical protein L6452_28419 [Arctium lappa]|uniref:Uncharacterized protein n=1 Tax=Arctium lappa TaxID=4217 RepID=A0ACB9A2Q9_ARCLA|nr:hypothetical protein L6452_28419 [Arctium lappa]